MLIITILISYVRKSSKSKTQKIRSKIPSSMVNNPMYTFFSDEEITDLPQIDETRITIGKLIGNKLKSI